MKFLPALLGIAASDLDNEFRKILTHGVKTGGIAIRNPVDTAVHVHETSLRATSHLITSMVDKEAAYGFFVLLAVCSAICSATFGFFLPGRTLNG